LESSFVEAGNEGWKAPGKTPALFCVPCVATVFRVKTCNRINSNTGKTDMPRAKKTPASPAVVSTVSSDNPNDRQTSRGAKTITVMCKYPPGLELRVFQTIEIPEATPGGNFRMTPKAQQVGKTITINGPAAPVNGVSPHEIAGGYAFTFGVDAEMFDRWLEQNRDSDLVKNRLILKAPDRAEARAISEEHAAVDTNIGGLVMPMKDNEPIRDPRVKREVRKITAATAPSQG